MPILDFMALSRPTFVSHLQQMNNSQMLKSSLEDPGQVHFRALQPLKTT